MPPKFVIKEHCIKHVQKLCTNLANVHTRKLLRLFCILMLSPLCHAQGVLHLKFHMGLGAQGRYFIGGTVENKGDAAIPHGYLVISLLNKQCHPVGEKLYMFGPLAAQHQHEFRVPIEGQLDGYRLTAIKALDDMGFPLETVDETQTIIDARKMSEEKRCLQAKTMQSN